jgi:DNA ligase-1
MFKPMLSATCDVRNPKHLALLKFPLMGSPKYDGIRCTIQGGVAYSRNGKPIRNKHVQACIGKPEFEGYDGELIVGDPTAPDCFQKSAAVMSFDQVPDFKFYVFDQFHETATFMERQFTLQRTNEYIVIVDQVEVNDMTQLEALEELYVSAGYEGLMLRDPEAVYLQGRPHIKTQMLMKIKRFLDAEFVVIGREEEVSIHGDPKGSLGALILQFNDRTFRCGCGFTKEQRQAFWTDDVLGKTAKVKYFGGYSEGVPRFPSFIGWRDAADL